MDTVVANIFGDRNIKQIKSGKFRIFGAGLIAKKDKEGNCNLL